MLDGQMILEKDLRIIIKAMYYQLNQENRLNLNTMKLVEIK